MRPRTLLVAAAVAVLGFAPAPLPRKDRRGDLTDVTGVWEFVECQMNGTAYAITGQNYNADMTPERFIFAPKKGGGGTRYDMRLDPRASPPSFTWSQNNRVSWVGSYRLSKGEMTMIFNSGDRVEQRPTDFAGKPQWRYVLRRIQR
jgi:uncharacterized protein (TIGR03067 family)